MAWFHTIDVVNGLKEVDESETYQQLKLRNEFTHFKMNQENEINFAPTYSYVADIYSYVLTEAAV